MDTAVAGRMYHQADDVWPFLRVGNRVELRREDDNRYDPSAVAIWFSINKKAYKLGYLPKTANETISALLDMGWDKIMETTISRLDPSAKYDEQIGLIVRFVRNPETQNKSTVNINENAASSAL